MENKTEIPDKKTHDWMVWLHPTTYVEETLAILEEMQAEKEIKKSYNKIQIYTVRRGGSNNFEILKAMKKVAEKAKADYDLIHKPLD